MYRIKELKKGKKGEKTFYEIEKQVQGNWFVVGPAGDSKTYADWLKGKFEKEEISEKKEQKSKKK